jgi:hypothetical protein
MDEEVDRLRNLRSRALYLRALCSAFAATSTADGPSLRASLLAWRIAKIISGHLRAHPNRSVRRGPGIAERSLRGLGVQLAALRRRSVQRRESLLLAELEVLKRTLEDVRALTRSATLSDSLGRAHGHAVVLLRDWQRTKSRGVSRIQRGGEARDTGVRSLEAMSERPYLGF